MKVFLKNTMVFFLTFMLTGSLAACGGGQAGKADDSSPATEASTVSPAADAGLADAGSTEETAQEEEPGAEPEEDPYDAFREAASRAEDALETRLTAETEVLYVYKDFGDTENHYTQKALMAGKDDSLVYPMDENWTEDPFSGTSCIRCSQETRPGDWGGWLFLNGYLPEGSTDPMINDGTMDGQGLDLTGAEKLRFLARGENGGEKVEFFTCGFGFDGETGEPVAAYPDSCRKKSLGTLTLSKDWTEYTIDLQGEDLSYIVCGFGYVLSGDISRRADNVFYLDDIAFVGDFAAGSHCMLRSYDTDNIYIRNAAFSYDNALTAMAFLSEGKREEAEQILDAFVYAVENDRYQPGRVRNAYGAGDITAFPGWNNAARLPGWYDNDAEAWYEDRYQTGSNVGNTSYVALALLQYDALYGNDRYLETAGRLMDWVIDNCSDDSPGFTGGYDGWPEGGPDTTYVFTYKSIEHNIDAYAAFQRLYEKTNEDRYRDAARSALTFIESMYDPDAQVFYTGTLDDGKTPNKDNIVLDAQVWACLSLGDAFAPYLDSLETVRGMEGPEGGYPFCASNENGGWWAEGTAYTALMYRQLGQDDRAVSALKALEEIQLENGMFPAATVDNLSTGFDLFDGSPWEYSAAPHLAPTAWFIMAINDFNPYAFPND